MTKSLRHVILITFAFQAFNFCGQVKLKDEFHLKYKNKNKTIHSSEDVRIIADWHKDSDTLQVEIHPQSDSAFFVSNDTFAVRPDAIFLQKFIDRGRKDDSSPYYPLSSTYVIKMPISAIERISVAREAIQWPTNIVGYLALTSAVIVAPIASIDKPFNKERYVKIVGYSLITAVSALTINLTFGHKKYYLKKHKSKKVWTLN
jgi:hypothetical protein